MNGLSTQQYRIETVGIAATAATELAIERTWLRVTYVRGYNVGYNDRSDKQFSGNSDKVSRCV